MNNKSPLLETSHSPPSSNMSELDSFSDSDWLDLSSNRESDDNDSVMSGESDHEDMGLLPLSRRSSLSTGSSRDGEIDAWEGFVEESGDEDVQNIELGLAISEPITAGVVEAAPGASGMAADTTHDPVEEQRVKDALDQSLISTLSTSRTSSASTHASLRDLRLSFPDPLTRSQDELNRSYESALQSDTTFTATDVPTDASADVDNVIQAEDLQPTKEEPKSVPDSSTAEPSPQVSNATTFHYASTADLEIVLYGNPSPIKWSFVQDLMRKAVLVSGLTLSHTTLIDDVTRRLYLQKSFEYLPSNVVHMISVHDRTENVINNNTVVTKRPSLAILYLPSNISTLPDHTLYLPVLVPPDSADSLHRIKARNVWNSFSVPSSKVVRLELNANSPIFDSRNLSKIQDIRAYRLFQRLFLDIKRQSRVSWSNPLSPVHAVTLFALLSLIVGFTMNMAFRRLPTPTTAPSTSPVTTFWGVVGPDLNSTSTAATASKVNAPPLTTHRDLSLSVYIPGTTSLSITPNRQSSMSSMSALPKDDRSKRATQADQVQPPKDVMVRPGAQLLVDSKPSTTASSSVFKLGQTSESKSTALSQVVDSLSGVFDERVSRFRSDLDELFESLDELSSAIRLATKKRVNLSKGKARQIRERVQYRHDRARGRAKELRQKGKQIFNSAGEQFMESKHRAQRKARDISKDLTNSDSWRAYQKVHAEWVATLRDKGGEGAKAGHQKSEGKCTTAARGSSRGLFSWSYAELHLA